MYMAVMKTHVLTQIVLLGIHASVTVGLDESLTFNYACTKRRDYWLLDIVNEKCIYLDFSRSCTCDIAFNQSHSCEQVSKENDDFFCKSNCICQETPVDYMAPVNKALKDSDIAALVKALDFWTLSEWYVIPRYEIPRLMSFIKLREADHTNGVDLRMLLDAMQDLAYDILINKVVMQHKYLGNTKLHTPAILNLNVTQFLHGENILINKLRSWINYRGFDFGQINTSLACEEQWTISMASTSEITTCYKAMNVSGNGNFFDSKATCGAAESVVAIPRSNIENGQIAKLINEHGADFGWIGVVKGEDGFCIEFQYDTEITWMNWNVNELHDTSGHYCTKISRKGEWVASNCDVNDKLKRMTVVCQKTIEHNLKERFVTSLQTNDIVSVMNVLALAGLREPMVDLFKIYEDGIRNKSIAILGSGGFIYPHINSNAYQQIDTHTSDIFWALKAEYQKHKGVFELRSVDKFIKTYFLERVNEFANIRKLDKKKTFEFLRTLRPWGVTLLDSQMHQALVTKKNNGPANLTTTDIVDALKTTRMSFLESILMNNRKPREHELNNILNNPPLGDVGLKVPIQVDFTYFVDSLILIRKSVAEPFTIETLLAAIDNITTLYLNKVFSDNRNKTTKDEDIVGIAISSKAETETTKRNRTINFEDDTSLEPYVVLGVAVTFIILQWVIFILVLSRLGKRHEQSMTLIENKKYAGSDDIQTNGMTHEEKTDEEGEEMLRVGQKQKQEQSEKVGENSRELNQASSILNFQYAHNEEFEDVDSK